MDPDMPIDDVQTVRDYFGAYAYPFRVLGIVMGACGIVALLLALVGIYGIVAYDADETRTKESRE
jgi:hypothetical protein